MSFTVVLTAAFIASTHALNFVNTAGKRSYAEFPAWKDTSGEASLQFEFKTNLTDGLLIWCSDGSVKRNNNEFRLALREGKLEVYFEMGGKDQLSLRKATIGAQWNDMQWHKVTVVTKFRDVTVTIDDQDKTLTSYGKSDNLVLTSIMTVGWKSDVLINGFTGCIRNLQHPIGESRTEERFVGAVTKQCLVSCYTPNERCYNNGKCRMFFDESQTSCDCTGTGYRGQACDVKEPVGFLDEDTFIFKSMRKMASYRTNKIQFRFRTNKPSGVIVHSGVETNYVIIELYRGNVAVKMSFGAGEISMRAGDKKLHDGEWHSVVLQRFGREVNLIIDDGKFDDKKWLQYLPCQETVAERQNVIFGGHPYVNSVKSSKSKTNFKGCLQQVYFQDSKEMIATVISRQDIYTRVTGSVSLDCPVTQKKIIIDVKTPASITESTVPKVTSPRQIILTDKQEQKLEDSTGNKLSQRSVAWITGGICVGSIVLIFTLACGFHFIRRRYSGQFLAQNKAKELYAREAKDLYLVSSRENSPYISSIKKVQTGVTV